MDLQPSQAKINKDPNSVCRQEVLEWLGRGQGAAGKKWLEGQRES